MAWGPDFVNLAIITVGIVLILHDSLQPRRTLKRFPRSFSIVLFAAFGYLLCLGLAEMYSSVPLARAGFVFEILAELLVIAWIEQILRERPRTWILLFMSVLGGAAMALAWTPGVIVFDPAGNEVFSGTFMYAYVIFLLSFYTYSFIFLCTIIYKAPIAAKIALGAVLVFLVFDYAVPFIAPVFSGLVFWPYVTGLASSVIFIIFLVIMAIRPEYLSVISFSLERILVLNFDSGTPIFHYSWRSMPSKKQSENFELLGPLLQALMSMSFEVLDRGHITSVKMDDGVLIFKKGEHVIAGIIGSRSTAFLEQQLEVFTHAFEIKFRDEINRTVGELQNFEQARQLVERVFRVIPVEPIRFSIHHKNEERDHLTPADAQLIQDMKDVFEV
jgi:hypothetical protein